MFFSRVVPSGVGVGVGRRRGDGRSRPLSSCVYFALVVLMLLFQHDPCTVQADSAPRCDSSALPQIYAGSWKVSDDRRTAQLQCKEGTKLVSTTYQLQNGVDMATCDDNGKWVVPQSECQGMFQICDSRTGACVGKQQQQASAAVSSIGGISSSCYLDCLPGSSFRALRTRIGSGETHTPQTCADEANKRSFKYFALQYGGECWADNEHPITNGATLLSQDKCNMQCNSDNKQKCGGSCANQAYTFTQGPVAVGVLPSSVSSGSSIYWFSALSYNGDSTSRLYTLRAEIPDNPSLLAIRNNNQIELLSGSSTEISISTSTSTSALSSTWQVVSAFNGMTLYQPRNGGVGARRVLASSSGSGEFTVRSWDEAFWSSTYYKIKCVDGFVPHPQHSTLCLPQGQTPTIPHTFQICDTQTGACIGKGTVSGELEYPVGVLPSVASGYWFSISKSSTLFITRSLIHYEIRAELPHYPILSVNPFTSVTRLELVQGGRHSWHVQQAFGGQTLWDDQFGMARIPGRVLATSDNTGTFTIIDWGEVEKTQSRVYQIKCTYGMIVDPKSTTLCVKATTSNTEIDNDIIFNKDENNNNNKNNNMIIIITTIVASLLVITIVSFGIYRYYQRQPKATATETATATASVTVISTNTSTCTDHIDVDVIPLNPCTNHIDVDIITPNPAIPIPISTNTCTDHIDIDIITPDPAIQITNTVV